MIERNYLCHGCGNIFRLEAGRGTACCPACGGTHCAALPAWSPVGYDLSESMSGWEYECQGCSSRFRLPVPGSPSQEESLRCPNCEDSHIRRLTAASYEPVYCG
jgi:DNA-directed RNA polymerase subunit RPC12/RpoP